VVLLAGHGHAHRTDADDRGHDPDQVAAVLQPGATTLRRVRRRPHEPEAQISRQETSANVSMRRWSTSVGRPFGSVHEIIDSVVPA
jgi:hypothetical protein